MLKGPAARRALLGLLWRLLARVGAMPTTLTEGKL